MSSFYGNILLNKINIELKNYFKHVKSMPHWHSFDVLFVKCANMHNPF